MSLHHRAYLRLCLGCSFQNLVLPAFMLEVGLKHGIWQYAAINQLARCSLCSRVIAYSVIRWNQGQSYS